jgi:hypothetical protein
MSPANDNSSAVRDLALGGLGLCGLPTSGGAGVDLGAGGFDHAAIVTLRTVAASSGKSSGFTGAGNRPPKGGSNLRPAPVEINAIAGALAAMLDELPVRGGIVDRLS